MPTDYEQLKEIMESQLREYCEETGKDYDSFAPNFLKCLDEYNDAFGVDLSEDPKVVLKRFLGD